MKRIALIAGIIIFIAVAILVAFFGRNIAIPIIDEACQEGYTRLGEGCLPLKDECESRGDSYYFDAIANECRTR